MTQKIKKITGLLVLVLGSIIALIGNNSGVLFAQDKATITFSDKGTILPFTVINPKTGEYILEGNWNMDVNKGKITNFTADMQVEVYGEPSLHTHQFMNYKQAPGQVFGLDSEKSGKIRGTIDIGLNNSIVHRNVSTDITIDRGILMSVTPDVVGSEIHQISTNPTIYGLIDSHR